MRTALLLLAVPTLVGDRVRLRFQLKDQSGASIENEVYLTVYQVPGD